MFALLVLSFLPLKLTSFLLSPHPLTSFTKNTADRQRVDAVNCQYFALPGAQETGVASLIPHPGKG